jgi:ketosteroid isomerase-like protein
MTLADVDAVAKAFHEGVASRDAAALAALYHPDARFLPPNMPPCEGMTTIQAAMQGLLDMGARSLDLEPVDVRESGDMTIEYGRYRLGLEPAGAPPVTDIGKYLVVHQTRPDGTKILFDIFNSNGPPESVGAT